MSMVGTGTTLTFPGFAGELLDINPPSLSREAIETSHMGTTGAKTFTPALLYDGGEVTVSVAFDADTTAPISGAEGALVIANTGATLSIGCQAFVTGVSPTIPFEDKATADITFKVSGVVTGLAE